MFIQISDWIVENTGCRNNTGVLVGTTEDIDLVGHAMKNIDLVGHTMKNIDLIGHTMENIDVTGRSMENIDLIGYIMENIDLVGQREYQECKPHRSSMVTCCTLEHTAQHTPTQGKTRGHTRERTHARMGTKRWLFFHGALRPQKP